MTNKPQKLCIISHTAHQIHPVYGYVGWSPTVREINFLAEHWKEVVHLGCLETLPPRGSSHYYTKKNIKFIPIPAFGGRQWWKKINILYYTPLILFRVHKAIDNATEVQLRLPMGIGLILLIYFRLRKKSLNQTVWVKYATNWETPSKSVSYRWQQRLLRNNWINCKVTINGGESDQPSHCKSFENPCLTGEQHRTAERIAYEKELEPPFTFIFIGRVDTDKGADLLLDSLSTLPRHKLKKLHIVGDGPITNSLMKAASTLQLNIQFHGFVSQEDIFNLLKESHFLILPSKSEGFPKVVAEGLNFGCLPIISSVGSIPHYIRDGETGLIIPDLKSAALSETIIRATELNKQAHERMIHEGRQLASKFTFEAYLEKLYTEVLSD